MRIEMYVESIEEARDWLESELEEKDLIKDLEQAKEGDEFMMSWGTITK
jgi:hypothetical protein